MTRPDRATEAMIASRRHDSIMKRARVTAAIEQILTSGQPITFTSVARTANVSAWLVRAEGVRQAVERARRQQTQLPSPVLRAPSSDSLKTELAIARQQITRLRAQADDLRGKLRLSLGRQLDDLTKPDLVTRINELENYNTTLVSEVLELKRLNGGLITRVAELEEELAAVRTSLRRMIREENRNS